jgi:phosphate/phosphite/phosphonate ABC transporter binding protein
MAFTPSRDPTALQESADAFVAVLARLSGVPVRAQVASDYAGVIEALRSRRVDLAFVHPVGYVLARREAGCEILVRDVWENRTAYKASFYVREASGIKHIEELRGRTVAFVDPASSSGYIYPMVLLMKRGLVRDRDPKTFFKDALFAGTHEAALRAVLQGRVDAATTFDMAPQAHLKDPALVAQLVLDRRDAGDPGGGHLRPPGTASGGGPGAQAGAARDEEARARHGAQGHLRHRRLRGGAGRGLRSRQGRAHAHGLPAEEIIGAAWQVTYFPR